MGHFDEGLSAELGRKYYKGVRGAFATGYSWQNNVNGKLYLYFRHRFDIHGTQNTWNIISEFESHLRKGEKKKQKTRNKKCFSFIQILLRIRLILYYLIT